MALYLIATAVPQHPGESVTSALRLVDAKDADEAANLIAAEVAADSVLYVLDWEAATAVITVFAATIPAPVVTRADPAQP